MKKAFLTAMMLSFAFSINTYACEDHKQSKKDKQSHSDKAYTCETCKKSQTECKCGEKHKDHEHPEETKTETKIKTE